LPNLSSLHLSNAVTFFRFFFGVLLKPGDTFSYLREHGSWTWLAPLALVLALTLISRIIAAPIERAQVEAARAALQEQLGSQGGTFEFVGGPGGANFQAAPANDFVFQFGLPLAGVLAGWLVCALLLFGLAWILGGRPSLGGLFRLSGWALIPSIARLVVAIAIMLIAGRIPAPGVSGAFNTASPISADVNVEGETGPRPQFITVGSSGVFAGPSFFDLFKSELLAAIDVYGVWALILLVIGVAAMARFGWFKALIAVSAYWVVSLVFATLPPLISFALGGLLGGGPTLVGPWR